MKKLIENNIVAKSFRCIDSVHNLARSELALDTPEADQSSAQPSLRSPNPKPSLIPHKQTPTPKPTPLKQKYIAQQVSCLYSQHIYKSTQRDFMMEEQVEKYRLLLEAEKKQKMALLREQKELRIQVAQLGEEKQIVLFALDSLTAKLDSGLSGKKNKELRRQTAEFIMSRFSGHDKLISKGRDAEERFKTDPESASNSGTGTQSQVTPHRPHAHFSPQLESHPQEAGSNWQKMKIIRDLKQQLNMSDSCEIKNIVQEQERAEAKIAELTAENGDLKVKVKEFQEKLKVTSEQNQGYLERIGELERRMGQLTDQMSEISSKLAIENERNAVLAQQLNDQRQKQLQMLSERQASAQKIKNLETQLKLTQEQYNERQQKQKKSIQVLQKFSKDLKLSDEKIQYFLKEEFSAQTEENKHVACTKKTYNEQLSYILHLCKKKEALYENLVTEFKDKMKEDDFRVSILQKKINNYSKQQEELRFLVANEADRDTICRKIVRFGH